MMDNSNTQKIKPMPSDRWRRVEEIYHSALERSAEDRATFLADACSGDDELRRDVESLIRQDSVGAGVLDHSVWNVVGARFRPG